MTGHVEDMAESIGESIANYCTQCLNHTKDGMCIKLNKPIKNSYGHCAMFKGE